MRPKKSAAADPHFLGRPPYLLAILPVKRLDMFGYVDMARILD